MVNHRFSSLSARMVCEYKPLCHKNPRGMGYSFHSLVAGWNISKFDESAPVKKTRPSEICTPLCGPCLPVKMPMGSSMPLKLPPSFSSVTGIL